MPGSKVKNEGHHGQISSPLKMHCKAIAANTIMQQQTGAIPSLPG